MFARLYKIMLLTFIISPFVAAGQTLSVASMNPQKNGWDVGEAANITITFSATLDASSVNGIRVYSRNRGVVAGSASVSTSTLVFNPSQNFANGDLVLVTLTTAVKSNTNNVLGVPFMYQFNVRSGDSPVNPPVFKQLPIDLPEPQSNSEVMESVDLDGDGDMDIILSNRWMENDGEENFTPHTIEGEYFYTYDVEVADIDYDGDMDLVSGGYDGLSILQNDGSEAFTKVSIGGSSLVVSLALADNNNDGRIDILAAEQGDNKNLSWYINNSNGTFTKQVVATADFYYQIQACDVNGDQLIDIVTLGQNNFQLLKNTGSSYVQTILGNGPYANPFVADMDGDHDVDLVVGNGVRFVLMENSGTGTFTEHEIFNASFSYVLGYDIADMDADGLPDIVIGRDYSYEYFRNQGNNTFALENIRYLGESPSNAIVRDLDSDGDMDLVYRLYYTNIGWLKNTNRGEALPFEVNSITGVLPDDTDDVAWADYDKDGDQDVLVTAYTNNGPLTHLYKQTSNGLELAAEFTGTWLGDCTWFDLENDGDLDIIVGGATVTNSDAYKTTKTFVYVNTNGSFSLLEASSSLPGIYQGSIITADFDNDGIDEIILGGSYDTESSIFKFHNNQFTRIFNFEWIATGALFAVSDIDLDGDLDFAATGWLGSSVTASIFVNEGDLKFTQRKNAFTGISSGRLLFRDFDADSDPDLAVLGYHHSEWGGFNNYSYYINTNGNFELRPRGQEVPLYSEKGPNAADFNNDGYTDLFTRLSNEKYLLFNDKAGWFEYSQYEFVDPPTASSQDDFVEPIDFDNDSDVDVMLGKTMYRNNIETPNQAPLAPTTVGDSVRNNTIYMYWSGATDAETPTPALTYQPYVGSSPGTSNLFSSRSNLQTGRQYVQREGTARKFWKVKVPAGGNYHWGVQTIDATLSPSLFSSERMTSVIYIDGPSRSCTQVTQKYKAVPAGSYTWTVKGGQVVSNTGSEIEVIWTAEGYGSVAVANSGTKNTLDVRIVTKPQPAITGNLEACAESADNVYLTPFVDKNRYLWLTEGGTILGDIDSNKVYVKWGTAGNGKLRVLETSKEFVCVIEQQLTIVKHELPVPSIDGADALCASDKSLKLYTNESSEEGNALKWTVFGGSIMWSDESPFIQVSWDNQAFGRVTLKETNQHCSAVDILEVAITSVERPDISGNFVVCDPAVKYTYNTPASEGYTYEWTVKGGTVDGVANKPGAVIKWSNNTSGTVTIKQTLHECTASDSVHINIYPPYNPEITLVDESTIKTESAFDYQWSLNGTPIEGGTTQELKPKSNGNYTVKITDYHGCVRTSKDLAYIAVGLEDTGDNGITMYPNPAAGFFHVEIDDDYRGHVGIVIYDVLGKVITSVNDTKYDQRFVKRFEAGAVASGFVIVEVTGADFTTRRKVALIQD